MKKVTDYLEQLDFSEAEAKLYLTLLKTGQMTIAELAKKAGINRTAAYGYINSLLEKGVISQTKGSANKVIANPPAQLHYLVDEKISSANILKEKLSPIVTLLNASFMQSKAKTDSAIKYYKGRNSILTIYKEILRAEEIRAYYSLTDVKKVFPETSELADEAFERNPKLIIYEICEDSALARKFIKPPLARTRHIFKFLPSEIKLTATDTLIYDGKVAIIHVGEDQNATCVVLENRDYYNNSKQIFDLLWRVLPDPILD